MLDQFRQDNLSNNNDNFQESGFQMTRKKLVVILSGAAFALLIFLFIIGIFRNDDSSALEPQSQMAHVKANSLEIRLEDLQARIEKLEQKSIHPNMSVSTLKDSETANSSQSTSSESIQDFDPVAMTDQALKQFIAASSNQDDSQDNSIEQFLSAQSDVQSKKEAPLKATKTAKPVIAQAKQQASKKTADISPQARTYVVQKGDTLSQISVRYFGTPNRWKTIYDANRDRIANINNLKVGTALVIPEDRKT